MHQMGQHARNHLEMHEEIWIGGSDSGLDDTEEPAVASSMGRVSKQSGQSEQSPRGVNARGMVEKPKQENKASVAGAWFSLASKWAF